MSEQQEIKAIKKQRVKPVLILDNDSIKLTKRKYNKKPVLIPDDDDEPKFENIIIAVVDPIQPTEEGICEPCSDPCCSTTIKEKIENEIIESTDSESSKSSQKKTPRVKMTDEERKAKKREYYNKYYAENKDKIAPKKKEWKQNNKDKINTEAKKEYQKKYDAEHKDQIRARRSQKVKCFCGFEDELTKSSMDKHLKSDRHRILLELTTARELLQQYNK
jgi:hypothetical protein